MIIACIGPEVFLLFIMCLLADSKQKIGANTRITWVRRSCVCASLAALTAVTWPPQPVLHHCSLKPRPAVAKPQMFSQLDEKVVETSTRLFFTGVGGANHSYANARED